VIEIVEGDLRRFLDSLAAPDPYLDEPAVAAAVREPLDG
jgi:hypothetical protein